MLGLGGTGAHGKRLRKWPWRRAPEGLSRSKAPHRHPGRVASSPAPTPSGFHHLQTSKAETSSQGGWGESILPLDTPQMAPAPTVLSLVTFLPKKSSCRGRVCLILSLREKREAAKSIPLEKLSHPPGTCRAPGAERGRACGGATLRGPRITPHLRAGARQVAGKSLGFGNGALYGHRSCMRDGTAFLIRMMLNELNG